MAVSVQQVQTSVWGTVLELTKSSQLNNSDPSVWATQLTCTLQSAGVALPSVELAHLLVSHICWGNHVAITWKFLEKALATKLVPALLVLALLSSRVVPNRRVHPAAYRLYMELLKHHTFFLESNIRGPDYYTIMKSVDNVLQLSQTFGIEGCEPGLVLVEFVFSIVWQLLEASLDDEGLLEQTTERRSWWLTRQEDMDVDSHDNYRCKKSEQNEGLVKANTAMAIDIIVEFLQNSKTSRILYLARQNMPLHWESFNQQLQLLIAKSSAPRNLKYLTPDTLMPLISDASKLLTPQHKSARKLDLYSIITFGSKLPFTRQSGTASRSSFWLPIDLFLEDCVDGSQALGTSPVEILTGLIKALQATNGASWHDTFLGLWIAALRLVQRKHLEILTASSPVTTDAFCLLEFHVREPYSFELTMKLVEVKVNFLKDLTAIFAKPILRCSEKERDYCEGPVSCVDTCLCILLCTTTLAVANIIEEEEGQLLEEAERNSLTKLSKEKETSGKFRKELITSLQFLGDFDDLLTPPKSVCLEANRAASKAVMVVSGLATATGNHDLTSAHDLPMSCSGNLRHLIVEACIARNLLDTSAYFWPGYVNASRNPLSRTIPNQVPGWASLMKGSPLTSSLASILVATPASSLAEVEKIYEIAISGSDEEKISAATILCGASLLRGWNVQEHVTIFIVKLLSPPVPPNYSGTDSHLINYAPFFNILLVGISPVDCVQIFSSQGLIPMLAGVLMPICEVFGSCLPSTQWTLITGEELTCHAVFSNAFILLLRLWRFNHPPYHENMMIDARPLSSQISPEYLLMVRNTRVASFGKSPGYRLKSRRLSKLITLSSEAIFMDSFPRLKKWHRQLKECIASTLSGLAPGTTVHQIVDALLAMMFRKINKGNQPLSPTSGSSSSSASSTDDASLRLKVPAWDILEATPFVLDAALTACAHGRLSSRELTTGLKDLADFLPASLATIVSYFSAEVTRGIWQPASMNGIDWPSPATNLSFVEQQIKKILAATGVDVPSLSIGGNSPPTIPLPLAAFLSVTITYKLDKVSERFLVLLGPALSSLASSCPWPCMPITASLWVQKVKRWSDFLVFSASKTVFHHNSDAVVQLLRSCFTSTLGITSSNVYCNGGVGSLLGHAFSSHSSGGFSPVAPGILYLKIHHSIRDVLFIKDEIVSLLMHSVRHIASTGLPREQAEKLKKTKYGMRYGMVSLAALMTRVKVAASLGASLIWLSGGLNLVQSLIKETIPSWLVSAHESEEEGRESGGVIAMLRGYALAYFTMLCGTFAWGLDHESPQSKRRQKVLTSHLEFLASALDGKVSLRCDCAAWHAYVTGYVSLMVHCTPLWVQEIDVSVLNSLSEGLRRCDEEELALTLLGLGGKGAMGTAAEMIIDIDW